MVKLAIRKVDTVDPVKFSQVADLVLAKAVAETIAIDAAIKVFLNIEYSPIDNLVYVFDEVILWDCRIKSCHLMPLGSI